MPSRRRAGSSPDPLSGLLRALRGDRSQGEAAALSGLSQAAISRAERARIPLNPAEAVAYARALGATPDDVARVEQLSTDTAASREHVHRRARLVRAAEAIQERVRRLERDVSLIRSWQPEVVPGILQTPAYTAAVIGLEPTEAWLTTRAARRALLDDEGRVWHQVMSEAALRWGLGSAAVMREQCDHLVALSQRSNVRIGVIPFGVTHPVAPPSAFHLFGDVASDATELGTSFVDDPRDVNHYAALFDQLHAVAAYEDEARELIERARRGWRRA